uniref:Putative kinesin n=1 Tax=Trypanosoma vivax (strain Y486) TaxID=1055687 RepID=G0TYN3_TRYVY|nr:putative kinesin [Trypanosoma vivax Y486]
MKELSANNDTLPSSTAVSSFCTSVFVAVRLRPQEMQANTGGSNANQCKVPSTAKLNEPEMDGRSCVGVRNKTVVLKHPDGGGPPSARFVFDHVASSEPSAQLSRLTNDANIERRQKKEFSGSAPCMDKPCPAEPDKEAAMDALKNEETEQQRMFEVLGEPLLKQFRHGCNSCLLTCGKTGSGKTHTLIGSAQSCGIIPRLCQVLLDGPVESTQTTLEGIRKSFRGDQRKGQVSNEGNPWECSTRSGKSDGPVRRPKSMVDSTAVRPAQTMGLGISYMEVRNGLVRDLLKPLRSNPKRNNSSSESGSPFMLGERKKRYDPKLGPTVDGLTTMKVSSWEDCRSLIQRGESERLRGSMACGSGNCSHVIFRLTGVKSFSDGKANGSVKCFPRIDVVELAGTEYLQVDDASHTRANTSDANVECHEQMKGARNSLAAVRRVLQGVACGSKCFVRGKNLLTYLLFQDYCEKSKVLLCATISPNTDDLLHTLSTLQFAAVSHKQANPSESTTCQAENIFEREGRGISGAECLMSTLAAMEPLSMPNGNRAPGKAGLCSASMTVQRDNAEAQLSCEEGQAPSQEFDASKIQERCSEKEKWRERKELILDTSLRQLKMAGKSMIKNLMEKRRGEALCGMSNFSLNEDVRYCEPIANYEDEQDTPEVHLQTAQKLPPLDGMHVARVRCNGAHSPCPSARLRHANSAREGVLEFKVNPVLTDLENMQSPSSSARERFLPPCTLPSFFVVPPASPAGSRHGLSPRRSAIGSFQVETSTALTTQLKAGMANSENTDMVLSRWQRGCNGKNGLCSPVELFPFDTTRRAVGE